MIRTLEIVLDDHNAPFEAGTATVDGGTLSQRTWAIASVGLEDGEITIVTAETPEEAYGSMYQTLTIKDAS